jgi:3-hydroxyisobutyrate dehydrogenase-like beta-hydroxyacid dehydrogenase
MNEQVGLVGFGIMGAAIATRLIDAGNSVNVYDASAAAMRRARDIGCSTAATPHQIARRARVTIISLPRPEHVVEVVRGSDQCLLAGASEGSVIVDTSTVDPATSQQNAEAALQEGVGYLDCPVLGRPANVGSWTLPTGGDARYIDDVAPILMTFAARIVHVGPSGHGNMLKLLNNLMFGAINAVTCEVFALGERLGMEPELLNATIAESGAATVSNLFRELGPKIVERDFTPDFSIDNMEKDISLGLAMARACGMTLEVSETGQRLNRLARDAGLGDEDTAAIVKVVERADPTREC